jgi:hypothetical protein
MAAMTELVGRLGMIETLDAAVGPIKRRDRGFSAGELLVGSRRRNWLGRISWSVWTGSGPMSQGR